MAFTTSALTFFIIGLAVTALPTLFMRKSKMVAAKTKDNGEKYIDYSNFVFWFIYGCGVSFIVIGALVFLFSDEPGAGIGFVALGLIFLIPTLILQLCDTTINWSPEYICGAKSGTRLKKNTILWPDVILVKLHPNKTIQLQDKSGKNIYWSIYHNGWYRIIEDLRLLRPDIDTSDFD